MGSDFDFGVIASNFPFLMQGLGLSLLLTLLAILGGLVLGTGLALMRLSGFRPAVAPRGRIREPDPVGSADPRDLLVLLPRPAGDRAPGRQLLLGAHRLCDVRGRVLLGDHPRRHPVASARVRRRRPMRIGLSYWQAQRYVILPQAFRNMIPILVSQGIILFQDTSLVFVVSLRDLMTTSSIVARTEGRLVEMYVFAACRLLRDLLRRIPAGPAPERNARHDRHGKRLKWYGEFPGADRLQHAGRQGRGGGGLRPFGFGQVDADQDASTGSSRFNRARSRSTASR